MASTRRTRRTRRTGRSGRTRRGIRNRRLWLSILALVVLIGGGGYVAGQEGVLDPLLAQVPALPGQQQPPPSETDVDADLARQQLAELSVAQWRPMRGYSRDHFSHWRTVDGCDVRQTVLARDGEDIVTEDDSCRVVSGTWHSPFDGETFTDPGDLDIDHVVPLAAAWRAGADSWDDERRAEFANDLNTPQLIAVSATTNRAKGDQDPSQWKPPQRSYWCQYAHDWVVVKHHWELTVTEQEQQALTDMLATCP